MTGNSIKTIKVEELMADRDKPEGLHFFIPEYQRGYRWKKTQMCQMLNDIYEFEYEKGNEEKFYCLQPLVVKKHEDGSWIVVDGQQRLTTIFIILTCIEKLLYKEKAVIYRLAYDNKPDLWDCLDALGTVGREVKIDENDIDRYHMTSAYAAVTEWLKNTSSDLKAIGADIREKLRTYTRFIWYEVAQDIEPEIIFTNINMGKIKLTNAELIKALLLKQDNYRNESAGSIAASQIKISSAWDAMEAGLHDEDFWLFLTGDGCFKDIETRIELIFRIMTGSLLRKHRDFYVKHEAENNPDTYTFLIFSREMERLKAENRREKKAPYSALLEDFWRKVTEYYNMFHDWYCEREWYHLIGFLLAQKKNQKEDYFEELCTMYRKNTKTDFVRNLKGKVISETGFVDNGDKLTKAAVREYLKGLVYQNREQEKAKIRNVLLLFNVVSMQENTDSEPRFPFRQYKIQQWDIEHIHSVSTEKPQSETERKNWLEQAWPYVQNFPKISKEWKELIGKMVKLKRYSEDSISEYDDIYDCITAAFSGREKGASGDEAINEISNLTLLDSRTNRSYKNAIFPLKRDVILKKSGIENFIPLCTKNVFLKYYSKDITQMYVWDQKDRKDYLDCMCETLYRYLGTEEAV